MTWLVAQDLVERGGGDAEAGHEMIGNPRIVGLDRAVERSEQRNEGAREIAEADQADPRAIEREAPFRAVEQPFLVPLAHGAVGRSHAAAEVDRHPERHLGDRFGEGGARREHMDSAFEAGLVVDVLEEIGFDVDNGAQVRRAVEPSLRHVALPDQERHFGEIGFRTARLACGRARRGSQARRGARAASRPSARRSHRGTAAADRSGSGVWSRFSYRALLEPDLDRYRARSNMRFRRRLKRRHGPELGSPAWSPHGGAMAWISAI